MPFYREIPQALLSIVFPNLCTICEKPLPSGRKIICVPCTEALPRLEPLLRTQLIAEIPGKQFDDLFVLYEFDEHFQKLIHLLKYKRILIIAQYFAHELARIVEHDDYDMVCGIPLNHVRQRERGYNQSNEIARHFCSETQLPFQGTMVSRIKNTVSQTKLSREQRLQNVANIFQVLDDVHSKKILLIDDVITTGSTLNSCAVSLKKAGALIVDVAAIATPGDILHRKFEQQTSDLIVF